MGKSHKYRNEILTSKFGRLQPFEFVGVTENQKRTIWNCLCDCGNTIIVRSDCLRKGAVKSCGCLRKEMVGINNPLYKGYQDLSGSFFLKMKIGAKRRGIQFTVTIEELWDLFIKQDKKCKYSGLPLSLSARKGIEQSASLDRIDSNQGYVLPNLQWVDKRVNFMKQSFSEKEFLFLVKEISKNIKF